MGEVIERVLPFTQVITSLTGGKYPTYLNYVPASAEYVVQATEDYPLEYFWWLHSKGQVIPPNSLPGQEVTEDSLIKSLMGRGESEISRIYTHHGTIFYVDENTWELRHGPISRSPANVCLVHNSNYGEIIFSSDDANRSAVLLELIAVLSIITIAILRGCQYFYSS